MTEHIQGNDTQARLCKNREMFAPTRRATGKAMQHDEYTLAHSHRLAYLNAQMNAIHQQPTHTHPFSVIARSTARQSWRCICTLLARSVTTSTTCKPPAVMLCVMAARNCSHVSTRWKEPPYICITGWKS